MRPPRWLRFGRTRRVGNAIMYEITADVSGVLDAFAEAHLAMAEHRSLTLDEAKARVKRTYRLERAERRRYHDAWYHAEVATVGVLLLGALRPLGAATPGIEQATYQLYIESLLVHDEVAETRFMLAPALGTADRGDILSALQAAALRARVDRMEQGRITINRDRAVENTPDRCLWPEP